MMDRVWIVCTAIVYMFEFAGVALAVIALYDAIKHSKSKTK